MAGAGRSALRRAGVWVLLATFFVGFLALGTWQLQRRTWKLALIERVDQRVHTPPVPLLAPSHWADVAAAGYEYLPVTVNGHWLHANTALSQAVTELGAGFWVLTPLRQADGSSVWINRGFIPDSERQRWPSPEAAADGAQVQITGLMRMNELGGGFLRQNDPAQARWHSRDVLAMAQAQRLPQASPFFIDASRPAVAAPAGTWPRAGMTVIRFHNSHLVYALTWFGLAALTLFGAWMVWRQPAAPRAAHGPNTPQPGTPTGGAG